MGFIVQYRPFSSGWFKNHALIVAGAFIIAAGYVFFITPHKIIPGGIYGISIVLHHTFGTPVGLTALVFNIPVTLLGIKVLGPRFGIKTFTGFILTSFFMDGLTYVFGSEPLIKDDLLLSSLYGGAVIGLGVGFLFKAKATCGGTDVMAMMLGKWTGRPLGQLMMTVDTAIVFFGTVIFNDWAIPMFSLIVIFLMGKVIDSVLQGLNYDKVVLIISDQFEVISNRITQNLHRGGTTIKAKGMYAGNEKTIIYTVLNRRELSMLETYIQETDPNAFVTVLNADEILGQGFKSLRDKLES
ncbi:MAG: YitT family protein [Bacteroidetes bacterium HGW-Bacteroidetes-1]|nr:MAG: YitT family protein [Bacteroidetes bacterium HGW-Bacteroidetes-1]